MTPDLQLGFRVGDWVVEPLKGTIARPDGESHHLQPKVMDVLVTLATNAGQPVTRAALLDEVWGEYTVSDEPLTRAIGELRRALGDSRTEPAYIETIPKRGYRLIKPVVVMRASNAPSIAIAGKDDSTQSLFKGPALLVSVIGLLAMSIIYVSAVLFDNGTRLQGSASHTAPPNSIAVMPFATCNDEEISATLAAGIADEVRRKLAQIGDIPVSSQTAEFLSVTSRTSSIVFWQAGIAPDEISRKLNVRYILVADLCELDGVLTTNVSLIDENGFIIESEAFEQHEKDGQVSLTLSQQIAGAVGNWLGATPVQFEPALVNREAREQLVLARAHLANGDRASAQNALTLALQIQPDYPEAMFEQALLGLKGLDLDQRQGLENARQRAEAAEQVALLHYLSQPQSFEANLIVGRILAAIADWEQNLAWRSSEAQDPGRVLAMYGEAEDYLRAALQYGPGSAYAAEVLAHVIDAQGRKNEALQLLEKAIVNDPFNPDLNWRIATGWAARGRYHDAIALLQRFNEPLLMSWRTWNWQLELMAIHGYRDDQCEALITLLESHPQIAAHRQIRFQMSWFIGDLLQLGLLTEAKEWRARLPLDDLPEWAQLMSERFYLLGRDDQQELARRTLERVASMSDEALLDPWYSLPMNWAWDLYTGGETDAAIELMEKLQFAPTLRDERDTIPSRLLARLLIRSGRIADAQPVLDRLTAHLEREVANGIRHPVTLYQLAEVNALQGRNETAIQLLEMAVDNHWHEALWDEPWSETFGDLANDPRVERLRQRVDQERDRQAERVRTLLAEHDLDELLSPLRSVAGR